MQYFKGFPEKVRKSVAFGRQKREEDRKAKETKRYRKAKKRI